MGKNNKLFNNKIIITGGSGFIGTHLVGALIQKGYQILNIDIKPPKVEEYLEYWKNVDICNLSQLGEVITDFAPDYVIHLAARTDLRGKSLTDYSANTDGVSNLLTVLDGVSNLKRVLFTSSMYVCEPGYAPKDFNDYAPHTLYGESKVITEKLIKKKNPGYSWAILRPTSIWGPYFGEPYDKFFKLVISHYYFHLGEKACKKTYGYIDNTVHQIISLLNSEELKVNCKTFYLGDYEPYDITEWANEIAGFMNFSVPTVPYFLFQLAGWFGDMLKLAGINFPMTSFRLKNMTTDNVHNLDLIKEIAPNLPTKRIDGVKETIKWLNNQNIR